jgi:citrate lyase beta subunit
MAIIIDSLDNLQNYLTGVLGRSDHHAGNVRGVSLTLIGAILSTATGEIKVREYNGRPANMIWFSVGANNYMMKYNHSTEMIELHDRVNGVLRNEFDDSTPYNLIIDTFSQL